MGNTPLCREHYRITFRVSDFPPAKPGQFVHLSPDVVSFGSLDVHERGSWQPSRLWQIYCTAPMLRRAFSIAGLQRSSGGSEIDVIYRVVGTSTRWMESLRAGDGLSVLGPLGNSFPISGDKPVAWSISGGVGLPPMLWLAEALASNRKSAVAFCGARSADLLPLRLDPKQLPPRDASRATFASGEFARHQTSIVVSTDDGSAGFHGRIGEAFAAYHRHHPISSDQIVVYTCGPEPMMRVVAEYCVSRGIECYVCIERNMACGTGLCQSCVVPVHDSSDAQGWRYRLCCTDGPVFHAHEIIWDSPDAGHRNHGTTI